METNENRCLGGVGEVRTKEDGKRHAMDQSLSVYISLFNLVAIQIYLSEVKQ